MKRVIKYIFIFLIFIITGCTNNSSNKFIQTEKVVNDKDTIETLSIQIKGLESVPKTMDLYYNGNGNINDYNNDEILLYGLNVSEDNLSLNMIKKNIRRNFNNKEIEYKSVDRYIYDNLTYAIDDNYIKNNKKIISYIDKVSTIYNYYYVTVYAGIINNDEVYGDFDENTLVQLLYDDITIDNYEIDKNDLKQFTKFRYKFERNNEGNYIFVEFKKI